jgi:glycosyltransferase involved in cell wall biosynthesis
VQFQVLFGFYRELFVKLSIVTPCLNRAGFILDAVESVLVQDYENVEHLVMDGGSTDGTLELLNSYPHLRVYSQPDEGIYDAMNKGVRRANGDVIGFLNSDDLYDPCIFNMVVEAFLAHPEIEALSGGASILQMNSEGEWARLLEFPCVSQNELLSQATEGAPIFNAWFFRKTLVDRLAGFDTRYLYVADRDFLIRMSFIGARYSGLDRNLYLYRMHPGSYTLSGGDSGEAGYMFESRRLVERYLQLGDLAPEASASFRRWHSQISLEQVMTAWHRRAYRRIVSYMISGMRVDLAWPWVFGRKLVERLPFILKGNSNR